LPNFVHLGTVGRENLIGFLSNICGNKEAKDSEDDESPRNSEENQSAQAEFLKHSSSSDSDNEI
jgi:hypothetical protein